MNTVFLQLIILGVLAGAANVIGGVILFPPQIQSNYKRFLKYLLALSAGFMLAVIFIELVPRIVSVWQNGNAGAEALGAPMILLLAGYLVTQFFEHTIAPHFHLGEEVHSHGHLTSSSAYTAVGGLMIHTFFDGVSISAASQLDSRIGFLVFLAIFLHKFPEGFTIGSMILAAGKGLREVLITTTIVGVTTLIGVLAFYFVGSGVDSALKYALPFACGVTLYVAASDLIPEVNHHGGKNPLVSLSVFAGVALFFGLHQILEHLGH